MAKQLVSIDVRADISAVIRDLAEVQRRLVPAAAVSAMNRTARTVRTVATREISQRKGITPQRLVRNRIKIQPAKRSRLVAHVIALLAPVKAITLGSPRQTRSGVSVRRHQFPGAFVATMPTGHLGVFKREGAARLPIDEQSIPLQPEAEHIVGSAVDTVGRREWPRNFTRELQWRLSR